MADTTASSDPRDVNSELRLPLLEPGKKSSEPEKLCIDEMLRTYWRASLGGG
ncbi:hypothetical protein CMV_021678, partial [Castanea mollissima]